MHYTVLLNDDKHCHVSYDYISTLLLLTSFFTSMFVGAIVIHCIMYLFFKQYKTKIDNEKKHKLNEFIIRLNGVNFSKLMESLKNEEFERIKTPYINDFKRAMDLVTADLVEHFNATTGFNYSDEILLHFVQKNNGYLYKPEDIPSLLNRVYAYAVSRFDAHLIDINPIKYEIISCEFDFTTSLITNPSIKESVEYFKWISQLKCYEKFVRDMSYCYFDKNTVDNLSLNQCKLKLLNEHQLDIDSFNVFLRYGTFIKQSEHVCVRFALPHLTCNKAYYDFIESKDIKDLQQTVEMELCSELN